MRILKLSVPRILAVAVVVIALVTVSSVASTENISEITGTELLEEGQSSDFEASSDGSDSESRNALQDSLQAYYRFDDPEVSRGDSLELDGSDDRVVLSGSLPPYRSDFSLVAWFKTPSADNSDNNARLVSQDWLEWELWVPDGTLTASIGNFSDRIRVEGPDIEDNRWHQAVASYDRDGDMVLYLDGEEVGREDIGEWSDVSLPGDSVTLGSHGGAHYYNGSLDDVRVYNRSLSESEIENFYREKSISGEGLVLHHDFNEGPKNCDLTSSEVCLTDKSGNGNDGAPENFDDNDFNTVSGWLNQTPLNHPSLKDSSENNNLGRFSIENEGTLKNFDFDSSSGWTEGVEEDSALEFDGNDDYVEIGHSSDINISGEVTVSQWVRPDNLPSSGDERMWAKAGGTSGTDVAYQSYFRDGSPKFEFYADGGWHGVSGSSVNEGEWIHLVYTFDGSEMRLYKNGTLDGSSTSSAGVETNEDPLNIGFDTRKDYYFNGIIGEMKIFNRSVSDAEAESIYQSNKLREGIVGEWKFEEGVGETAYDTSGLNREGILGTTGISPSKGSVSTEVSVDGSNFSFSVWAHPGQSQDWDEYRWRYRRPVTVQENSGQILQDYQINLTVDTASLIQAGKIRPDCSDLQFVQDGQKLSHDLSGCNSEDTNVTVEVAEIPSNGEATVWMYYGGSKDGGQNPEEAYYIHDLHGSGYSGELLEDATYNQDEEYVELTENVDGQRGLLNYSQGTPEPGWKASWEYYIGDGTDADALWIYGWGSDLIENEDASGDAVNWIINDHNNCIGVGDSSECGSISNWNEDPATSQWEEASAYGHRDGNELNYSMDTLSNSTEGNWSDSSFPMGKYFGFGARTGGKNNYHRVKNITVTKFVEPEPTVSIGAEEKRPEAIGGENTSLTVSKTAVIFKIADKQIYVNRTIKDWQHIIGTTNGETLTLYLNGEELETTEVSTKIPHQNIMVANNFSGIIDEARVYNRSLSQSEVNRLAFQ